jgi:hypothetical protein
MVKADRWNTTLDGSLEWKFPFRHGSKEFYLDAFRNSADSHRHGVLGHRIESKGQRGRDAQSARGVARFRVGGCPSVTSGWLLSIRVAVEMTACAAEYFSPTFQLFSRR